MKTLNDYQFVAFDLETTGLQTEEHAIIEIGAVRFRLDGTVLGQFNQLVDPQRDIPYESTKIHGISNTMVEGQPTIDEVLPRFMAFLGDPEDTICMAHYARFDVGFINHACEELCMQTISHRVIDTVPIARKRIGDDTPNHKLETLIRFYDLADDEEHRALSDSQHLMQVFRKMVNIEPGITTMDELMRVSTWPKRQKVQELQSAIK